jgi:hypothetical protein
MEITLGNTYAGDSKYNPCTELVAETPLALNREALSPETERYSLTLWFKREASSILRLGTANSHLQIAADGKLLLVDTTNTPEVGTVELPFQLETANPPFQQISSDAMIAPADEWHHLAWVKNENAHTLYLNGIPSQPQTLVNVPNPASVNSMESVGANAYIVHLHAYDRALEASEIVTDRLGQYRTTESFTDQYPINFALKDRLIEGAPEMPDDKLIIEDIAGKERTYQRLVVTNVADETLSFVPNTNAVSKDNHHFELRFRNGTFASPSQYPKFDNFETENLLEGESSGIPSGWQATTLLQHPQDGSWSVYLLRTAALDVASNDTLEFPFEYTTADGSLGGRSTRVALSYQQIEYADDGQAVAGIREKQIDIINNSSNNAHVSALNERVTQADAKVDQLEEDAREEIDHLANLLNSHDSGSKDRLSNPNVSSFSINAWQETNSYTPDDYVTKDGILYKANSDITSDTQWNVANWDDRSWDASSPYAEDNYVQKDTKIYRAKQAISANTPWNETLWEVYAPSKEVLKSIIGVLGTIADNIKAVDDEVDARAAASDYIADQQETLFPLVASVSALTHDDQPAAGIVIGTDSTEKPKLQFTLNNTGLSPVTFTDSAEFRFIIPKGTGVDKLVETSSAAGTMDQPQSATKSDVSNTVVFKWTPDKTENADNVTVNGTACTLSIAGKTISFTLLDGITMDDHTPTVRYNQTTEGAARVATSINNGKLSVTITGKRDTDTDTWPSVVDLRESLKDLPAIVEVSGGSGMLNPRAISANNIIPSRESQTFTISNITPNATPGFVTIFIEYQGIVGYPSGKLSVGVSKITEDISQLVGGGNVGIGTTNPSAKLHISSGTSGDTILLLEADTDNNHENDNPMIQLRQDGGDFGVNIGFDQANFGDNKFGIGSRKYGNDYYDTFIINTYNGNVGIGTTNPSAKLHISSGTSGDAILLLEADTDNNHENDNPMIQLRQDGGDFGVNIGFDQANFGNNRFGIGRRKDGNDCYDTFIINTYNGRVGIGTTSPAVKLEVQGETGNDVKFRVKNKSSDNTFTVYPWGEGTNIYNEKDNSPTYFGRDGGGGDWIFHNGNVGIGTTSPSAKLHIGGTIDDVHLDGPSGSFIIGDSSGSHLAMDDNEIMAKSNGTTASTLYLNPQGGDVKIGGKLYLTDYWADTWAHLKLWGDEVKANSDSRLKKSIDVISGALRKITSLRGVSYKWNEQGLQQKTKGVKEQFISKENTPEANEKLWSEQIQRIKEENSGTYKGFIAQELETVFPEWVQEGEDGFKTIDTSELTTVLVEAIKELNEKLEKAIKESNDKFEKALEKLTEKVDGLAKK